MTARPFHLPGHPGRITRLFIWCAALILVLQLLGATRHHHDLLHPASDCASCTLAAQPAAPPAPSVMSIAAIAGVVMHLAPAPALRAVAAGSSDFLMPYAHAPPGRTR